MSNNSLKLSLHDYYSVSELSDNELVELISQIVDIDEVPSALSELYKRTPDIAISLGKDLITKQMGDEYLQGAVIEFIFDHDNNYIIEFSEDNMDKINYYVYGCILECLSIESKQPFGENLSQQYLNTLMDKYNKYNIDDRNKISEKYNSFINSYSIK